MKRVKKPLIWLMLLAMVVSLIPANLAGQASAASSAATYFIPENNSIRQTALLSTEPGGVMPQINRSNVYTTNSPNLTINGLYSYVAKDTMKVKVEQLNSEVIGNTGKLRWLPDANHYSNSTVLVDPTNTQRFNANDLTLYPGFNRITFSGMQGNVSRSDTFYVLYDKVPYVEELKIYGSSQGAMLLNEGTQVVVDNKTVSLKGKGQNASKVTFSINNGSALTGTVLADGTFFSPTLNLESGLNEMKISIQNGSDSVNITRNVYYFDANQPYTNLNVVIGGEQQKVLNAKPIFTVKDNTKANIVAQVILPYVSNDFQQTGVITVNGGTPLTFTVNKEVIIPGADGITPAYKLIDFTTAPFDLQKDTAGSVASNQVATIAVTYGTLTAAYTAKFQYLPDEVVITDMKYLEKFVPSGMVQKVEDLNKQTLNGASVDKSDYYILVETNVDPGSKKLTGSYLPMGTKSLQLELQSNIEVEVGKHQQIYKVVGFSNGQQKVRFLYENSKSSYNADISYVSKNYIYIDNLSDGQTFNLDSRKAQSMSITGKFIGFENISGAEYFINGISGTKLSAKDGSDIVLGTTASPISPSSPDFNLNLNIQAEGPLYYGDNKIVFTATSMDLAGNRRVITKEIHVYIIDTNVSTVNTFLPTEASDTRTPFTSEIAADNTVSMILAPSPEINYQDGKYVTSQKKYDLVLRGSGATILNLYLGTDLFFSSQSSSSTPNDNLLTDKDISKKPDTFSYKGKTYEYDFAGSKDDFILRIRNIQFDAPGSHVYNLELINSTGARANQRLEVVREVSQYRILAPQPTVGKQYIVNKNFVHFDIEAEGATKVIIGGGTAIKRTDLGSGNRFLYDYVGLKPDKANSIKLQITRDGTTSTDVISVFYTSTVAVDSEYMVEKISNKYSVFNKGLELSFPKGTVLQTANQDGNRVTKFYPDNKLLFGIADPKDGVVERRNDYGNLVGIPNTGVTSGMPNISLDDLLVLKFNSGANTANFTRVSNIFWVNGGIGEKGNSVDVGYKPSTNGLSPYSIEGNFTKFDVERKLVPSQRGSMKITFDSNIVDEVGSTITVFRYSDQGVWENVGGEVDTKSHTVTVPFDEFGYYTVMKLRLGYKDITNHPWARNYLNALYAKGIMNNLRADAFGADDRTTRGEFATLLVKGLNLPLKYDVNQQTFIDVGVNDSSATWDFKYIETAARAGVVTGLTDGIFGAGEPLSREQAAVMIARALKLKTAKIDDKLKANLAKAFTDSGSMDSYSLPSIDAVSKAKIMAGSPTTAPGQKKPTYAFNPKGTLTRAEAGKIAVQLFQKSTKIFPKNLS
ncbi:hypothetical protein J2Z69_002851 [Paenibacillus shirakamiensis]|uniref:SLH domain-containing protein n=1 Tax=Paenibacillus shirakamiensis TaxID=1265935 RepID=A0ABS4JJB1_9BACL|nr:S-layer homology domain-containing protein [Paenibacillus shirakamiensis]MBP2001795.1 hypothetical protein [Paenibacillus shirakamiensis]